MGEQGAYTSSRSSSSSPCPLLSSLSSSLLSFSLVAISFPPPANVSTCHAACPYFQVRIVPHSLMTCGEAVWHSPQSSSFLSTLQLSTPVYSRQKANPPSARDSHYLAAAVLKSTLVSPVPRASPSHLFCLPSSLNTTRAVSANHLSTWRKSTETSGTIISSR
jgi:hypothetical protein